MMELAKQGFAVACISYRGTFKDDVRFPAAVQDAKEAIRFLRANEETSGIFIFAGRRRPDYSDGTGTAFL